MADKNLENCIQLLDEGKHGNAIDCFDALLVNDPGNKEVLYLKGSAFFEIDDFDNAIKYFNAALKIDPDYIDPLNDKGVVLLNIGSFEDAKKCFNKAIKLDPKFFLGWSNNGRALLSLGKYSEALEYFEKSLELYPNYADPWYFKGLTLEFLERNEEALKSFKKAVQIEPEYVDAWLGIGVILDNLGDKNESLACFEKAVEINPENGLGWYNKGILFRELKKPKKALESFEKAIEIYPEYAYAWYQKGNVLRELKKEKEAIKDYSKFVEIVEDNGMSDWKLTAKRVKEYIRMSKDGEEVTLSHPEESQYWQWVTKSEYFLEPDGSERKILDPEDDSDPGHFWTCHKDTRIGDLILLYRAGKKDGVTYQDIKYLIQAQSDAYTIDYDEYAFEHGWEYGCDFKPLFKFEDSLTYQQLGEDPYLEDWNALRKRFQGIAFKTEERHWKRLQELLSEKNSEYKEFLKSFKPKEILEIDLSEKLVEEKLSENLNVLKKFGYDLKLLGRQVICIGQGGRIDLLCEDNTDNSLVIIELKIVKATRNTFGQISNYIGWAIKRKANSKNVKGIVISKGYDNEFDSAQLTNKDINHIELADTLDELGLKIKY